MALGSEACSYFLGDACKTAVEAIGAGKTPLIISLLAPHAGARRVGKRGPVVPATRFADRVHRPAIGFHASGMLKVRGTDPVIDRDTQFWAVKLGKPIG